MTKQILTVHPVALHVPPKPYTSGLHVWKCRNCAATLPDDRHTPEHGPILCRICQGVMDLTPVRRIVQSA